MQCFSVTGPLGWRELDAHWVVYTDSPPGVYEFDAFGAAVLFVVEGQSQISIAGLARGVAELTGEQLDSELLDRVTVALHSLALVGLVEVAEG